MYISLSIKFNYLQLYVEFKGIVWIILFSYGLIITIWFELPAISLWPNFEYFTVSHPFNGKWILFGFNPYELIVNIFNPYLNPIAVLKVNGCTSKHNGTSFWLKYAYHNNIL